jgi:hypothetical protein
MWKKMQFLVLDLDLASQTPIYQQFDFLIDQFTFSEEEIHRVHFPLMYYTTVQILADQINEFQLQDTIALLRFLNTLAKRFRNTFGNRLGIYLISGETQKESLLHQWISCHPKTLSFQQISRLHWRM